MLKQATSVLSKQGSKAEITQNKEEKLDSLAPTACFTNVALRTATVPKRVRGSYWQRMPVSLTALQGSTEMEYSCQSTAVEQCHNTFEANLT